MKCEVFLSKNTDEWATPSAIYAQAVALGMFDPCPLGGFVDGLKIDWGKKNFVNPPYSQLAKWIQKSIEQHGKGKAVLLLIPARTDTKAFRQLFEYGSRITFITGRLRFNDAGTAPFPSMIVNLVGGGYYQHGLRNRRPRPHRAMLGKEKQSWNLNRRSA